MKYKFTPTKVGTLNGIKKHRRVINPKECQNDLNDILGDLFTAFHKAVKTFNSEVANTPVEYRARCMEATLFNSKLLQCLGETFGADLKRGKYSRRFLYQNGYIILLKKLDGNGMPMNIKTKLSSSIANQQEGNLFNTEEDGTSPIIFFGYKKNKLGELKSPQIVYIDEGVVKWVITENMITEKKQDIPNIISQEPSGIVAVKASAKRKNKTV